MSGSTKNDWTLRALKARGMQIHALCVNTRCGRMFIADTDMLIAHFGPDTPLSHFDGQTCEACNEKLAIRIGFEDSEEYPQTDDDDGDPEAGRNERDWD